MFTNSEQAWLKNADKLFKVKPKNIRLYALDDHLVACKINEPCGETSHVISKSSLNPCCVLRDVHDDMNYGKG